jgi:ATP-dependent DNA helicase RecG
MEAVVIELCTNQWLTRRQISDLVQRNTDGLQSRFLTPMVEHRLLQLRYPETPNRTNQAYKATLESAKDPKIERETK